MKLSYTLKHIKLINLIFEQDESKGILKTVKIMPIHKKDAKATVKTTNLYP